MKPSEVVKITDRVFRAGAIDRAIRNFRRYETSRGTTYNAYLELAGVPVLRAWDLSHFLPTDDSLPLHALR